VSILDAIYDAIDDEEAMTRLPTVLAAETRSRSCTLQIFSPKAEFVEFHTSYFSASIVEHYVKNDLQKLDIWGHVGRKPAFLGKLINYDNLMAVDEFRNSEFYNQTYRPFGDDTARCIGGCIPSDDYELTIGFHRAGSDRSFDAEQFERARAITLHLRRLFVARAALRKVRDKAAQISAALDAPRWASSASTSTAELSMLMRRAWTF
jgi:hypothetical protein